jgi:hypothetical protein
MKKDLGSYDTNKGSDEGAEVQIFAPDGTELQFYIRVLGIDSDAFRQKSTDMARARAKRLMGAGQRFRRNQVPNIDPAQEEADEVELLATITIGWRGPDAVLEGKPLVFSLEACKMLYRRFRWIRKQVDEFVGERANFLPVNSDASPSSPEASSPSREGVGMEALKSTT